MKTKKAFINLISEVVPLVIISLLGIFKLKIFIQTLGTEVLGLYQLFSQIMVYVALVDGGLSSAVLYSLYKPNVEGDDKRISLILTGARRTFNIIGSVVFGLAALVAFFVPLFIKNYSFDYIYIVLAFALFSISNVIEYFFVPYRILFEVKEKKYIVSFSIQSGQILQNILEIVLLLCGWSFISILIMHSIVKLCSNFMIYLLFKKQYPQYNVREKESDTSFSKQIKHLMVHKINGLISYNIDIIIISKLLGLASVAIYSTYNYIINMLRQLLDKISGSMLAIIGNSLTINLEKTKEVFKELNSIMYFIAIIICTPLVFAINSFISIWYEGEILTSSLIAIAFSAYLFGFIIKLPITTFVTAAGLFKETKKCAIVDTIVNLLLSILFVWKFGIAGVVLATTISVFIAEYIMKNVVLHKCIFKENIGKFYLKNLKYFLILLVDLLIGYIIFKSIIFGNIFNWFVIFTLYTIVNSLVILLVYKIIGEASFMNRFIKLFKRVK